MSSLTTNCDYAYGANILYMEHCLTYVLQGVCAAILMYSHMLEHMVWHLTFDHVWVNMIVYELWCSDMY